MKDINNKRIKLNTILIIALIILVFFIGVCIYYIANNKKNLEEKLHVETSSGIGKPNNYTFELNDIDKFVVTTDMKWKTMQNDGGSNTNIFYQIDCKNYMVTKVKEDYHANLYSTPSTETEIMYDKSLNEKLNDEIKNLLNTIINEEDNNESKNYEPFTIETVNTSKSIYNKETINTIKDMLKKIDEL